MNPSFAGNRRFLQTPQHRPIGSRSVGNQRTSWLAHENLDIRQSQAGLVGKLRIIFMAFFDIDWILKIYSIRVNIMRHAGCSISHTVFSKVTIMMYAPWHILLALFCPEIYLRLLWSHELKSLKFQDASKTPFLCAFTELFYHKSRFALRPLQDPHGVRQQKRTHHSYIMCSSKITSGKYIYQFIPKCKLKHKTGFYVMCSDIMIMAGRKC